jgi:hypothetical protein
MPGLGHAWEYEDCIRIAEQAEGRKLSDGEISDYWYWQALKFMLDEPEKFVPLSVDHYAGRNVATVAAGCHWRHSKMATADG